MVPRGRLLDRLRAARPPQVVQAPAPPEEGAEGVVVERAQRPVHEVAREIVRVARVHKEGQIWLLGCEFIHKMTEQELLALM